MDYITLGSYSLRCMQLKSRHTTWHSICLALVFVIPIEMVLCALYAGVVPDDLAPGEHPVRVLHHSGHVVDKSSTFLIVVELHFALVNFAVLSTGVGGVHNNVIPTFIV